MTLNEEYPALAKLLTSMDFSPALYNELQIPTCVGMTDFTKEICQTGSSGQTVANPIIKKTSGKYIRGGLNF